MTAEEKMRNDTLTASENGAALDPNLNLRSVELRLLYCFH